MKQNSVRLRMMVLTNVGREGKSTAEYVSLLPKLNDWPFQGGIESIFFKGLGLVSFAGRLYIWLLQ